MQLKVCEYVEANTAKSINFKSLFLRLQEVYDYDINFYSNHYDLDLLVADKLFYIITYGLYLN